MKKITVLLPLLMFVLVNSLAPNLKSNRPHIILIIGDDIGWNDFSYHGSNQIPTPNIDALAYNGVILNRFYTQPSCSPSRAALLTGKYPIRYGYQGIPLSCGEDRPIPHDIEMLPEKLKKFGYNTHLVGKWHLSAARNNDTPTARGFDTYFGYWNGFVGYFDYVAFQDLKSDWNLTGNYSGFDLHDGLRPQWQDQGRYATDLFTEKSLQLIENHDPRNPMFLYLGHLAAHTGSNGTELGVPNITKTEETYDYIEAPKRRRYADIVNRLDKSVGQVVKKLNEKRMLENSVILFLSDNGAQTFGMYENAGSNYPLKGLKFTLLEGGVRGSAVLFSPLLERKGYVNNNLIHITDLYSTFMSLIGGDLSNSDMYDGINQWPTISSNETTLRNEILLNIDEVNQFSGILIDHGRFKYLNGSYKSGIYDAAAGDPGRSDDTPSYNISEVIQSEVNEAIQSLSGSVILTEDKIKMLRQELDISTCNGKIRETDPPCLGECLFDLWEDPCETENIIEDHPQLKAYAKGQIESFYSILMPSRDVKLDLNSNPQKCNNTWFPWLETDGCVMN